MADTKTIEQLVRKENSELEDPKQAAIEQFTTEEERDIYAKLKRILEHFRDNIFPDQFEIIKAKKLFSKEYEADIKRLWLEHKSAKIYPLIQTIHDTFMASLYDNDLKPEILPLEDTDPALADKAEQFFLWWVEMADAEQTQEIIRNEATLIWASYWIPWFSTITTEINGESQKVFIPAVYPVSFFEMFYSIWARDFYKAPEKFRRRFLAFQDLEYAYAPLWDDMKDEVEKKKWAILNYGNPLSQSDFTKIYDIDAYSKTYIENYVRNGYSTDGIIYDNTFNVLNTSNYVEVVELYIQDKLMLMINGYFVYSGKSPFYYWDDEQLSHEWPFIEMTYEKGIGSLPRGIGHKIMPHQKQCNSLFNSLWDAIYKHLNPMYAVMQWALYDPLTWASPTSIKYQEGATVTVNAWYTGNAPIGKLDFTDYNIVSIALEMLNNLKEDAYTVCWVNSYTMWWEGKVERSRSWVEQRVATAKARLAPVIASVGRFYSRLFYHWVNLANLSDAKMAFIEAADWRGQEAISIDDINKKFKIICTADTAIEEQRGKKLNSLITVMQQAAPLVTNEITGTGEIDKRALLDSIVSTVWLDWFKAFDVESYKKYIDDSYELKEYMAEKEIELQQKTQWAMPQEGQVAQWQTAEVPEQQMVQDWETLDFVV